MDLRFRFGWRVCKFLLLLIAPVRMFAQTVAPAVAAPIDDRALGHALCPIVYKVDDAPSSRGYHYLFYGNAFFINKAGYLLTAAHVLSQLHGEQPSLLIRGATVPPHFVQATVVAIDRDHDVALLRATPNPFASGDAVSFLDLTAERVAAKQSLLLAAERPFKPREAYTLDPSLEERSPGVVLGFEFSQLDKNRTAETELLLFDHFVRPGQSGGPVLSMDSHEVVGIVEGQWLRDDSLGFVGPAQHATTATGVSSALIPGAVIPIHYAIALLQEKRIVWSSGSASVATGDTAARRGESAIPEPQSLIAAPFPSQSLFGGEVMLDATIACNGTVTDVNIVHGDPPFLQGVLDAIRTWTFRPGCGDSRLAPRRIAIVFQFPQPYIPPRAPTVHRYDETATASGHDASARVLTTVEPKYPEGEDLEGSVILLETIDRDGKVGPVKVVQDLEPLTAAVRKAAGKWQFAPAKQEGVAVESRVIVVTTFRRPAEAPRGR